MKNLLQKSLKQLSIFAFIVFVLSIPSYFLLVDWIWIKELDENNKLIAQRIENEFNSQNISRENIQQNIKFWNEIQPVSKIRANQAPLKSDSLYTIRRQNIYFDTESIDRFRGLMTNIKINGQNYVLVVETNVEETEETVVYIAIATLAFFLILVIGFWILNQRLSRTVWLPFQDTLQKLKSFKLNSNKTLEFQDTDIKEFAELNETLDKLLKHNIKTFNQQKEFTENASHELQTPLAILKNKLDILLQSPDLTEKQYHIAEEMNRALIRSSRINKNLLLLAKIENNQFDKSETIDISSIVLESLEDLKEHFEEKEITLIQKIVPHVYLLGNSSLTEILIHNLVINALRHTDPKGKIKIDLSSESFQVSNSGEKELNSQFLFTRFSKNSNSSQGSGLGLAIVQEICKNQGWNIQYLFKGEEHHFVVLFSTISLEKNILS